MAQRPTGRGKRAGGKGGYRTRKRRHTLQLLSWDVLAGPGRVVRRRARKRFLP